MKMKRLLLASLFFLLPVTAFAVPTKPEQFEKLENEFSLECQKYGAESCAARFISMAACTYVFAVNQGKHPDEAMSIADELFVRIMRGNKIPPKIMFTEEKNIKPIIANEVAERTALCKEATAKAVPKLFKARGMEEPSPEIQERLTNSFGYWWISTIETIYKKG
tara:strand:- start:2267 stop:2761 length:495 start_codon:yes stop_codon:yes gene_type:complete